MTRTPAGLVPRILSAAVKSDSFFTTKRLVRVPRSDDAGIRAGERQKGASGERQHQPRNLPGPRLGVLARSGESGD